MEEGAERVGAFSHGYTYSGHPIGAAAANAVLDIVEKEDLPGNARTVGTYFQAQLKEKFAQLPIVGEVRGVGLMGAIEFVADRERKTRFAPSLAVGARISKAARSRGLIARAMPHGDILVLRRPSSRRRKRSTRSLSLPNPPCAQSWTNWSRLARGSDGAWPPDETRLARHCLLPSKIAAIVIYS